MAPLAPACPRRRQQQPRSGSSHVGEVGGVAAQVRNGTLTAERAPALMVTHLSAAQPGLMAQAGPVPRSNAEPAAAAQKIDRNAVHSAAALVRVIPRRLPRRLRSSELKSCCAQTPCHPVSAAARARGWRRCSPWKKRVAATCPRWPGSSPPCQPGLRPAQTRRSHGHCPARKARRVCMLSTAARAVASSSQVAGSGSSWRFRSTTPW